jgi:hypothetical protein
MSLKLEAWVESQLAQFPMAVELRKRSALAAWLEDNIPFAVGAFMLNARSLRVCSGISPDFAEIAAASGWPAVTASVPRHFLNIILVEDGFVMVDLSAIQFELCDHNDGREVSRMLKMVAKNPFRAIAIEARDPQAGWPVGNVRFPQGKFDDLYNPIRAFKAVKKYGLEDFAEFMAEADASVLDGLR